HRPRARAVARAGERRRTRGRAHGRDATLGREDRRERAARRPRDEAPLPARPRRGLRGALAPRPHAADAAVPLAGLSGGHGRLHREAAGALHGTMTLADREDVRDVLLSYARGVDAKDLARVAACFTPDAAYDGALGTGTIADALRSLDGAM